MHACSVVYNSLQPHGLKPAGLLCPWNSPGKNTGVSELPLLSPGDLPDPRIEPVSPASPTLADGFFSTDRQTRELDLICLNEKEGWT